MSEQPKVFINHYLGKNSFKSIYQLPEDIKKEVEKTLNKTDAFLYKKVYEEHSGRIVFESEKEKDSFFFALGTQLAERVEHTHTQIIDKKIKNFEESIMAFKQKLKDKGFNVQDVKDIESYPGINLIQKIENLIKSSNIFISILNHEQILTHKLKHKEDFFFSSDFETNLFTESLLRPVLDEFYIHSIKVCQKRINSLYIIPVIITDAPGSVGLSNYPFFPNLATVFLEKFENLSTYDFLNMIIRGFSQFNEDKVLTETNEKEQKKKVIEKSAPEFIQETLQRLEKNERNYRWTAIIWNILGFLALIAGAVLLFYYGIIRNPTTLPSWQVIIFSSVKAALVVVVLVAVAKYTFDLAKSNMNEALKNSDRIHAIEFGKFYLQVFGGEIDSKEMKEVFQNWNLQQDSSFLKLDSDKFDPKLIENINQLLATLSSIKAEDGMKKVKKKVSDEN